MKNENTSKDTTERENHIPTRRGGVKGAVIDLELPTNRVLLAFMKMKGMHKVIDLSNETGIDRSKLSKYVHFRERPINRHKILIADALGVDSAILFTEADEKHYDEHTIESIGGRRQERDPKLGIEENLGGTPDEKRIS